MIDIVSANELGMGVFDSQVGKAGNILAVQLGALEYLQDFGIDLEYFLSEDFRFQNDSFKAYLIERLSAQGISLSSVLEVVEIFSSNLTFNIQPDERNSSLMAR